MKAVDQSLESLNSEVIFFFSCGIFNVKNIFQAVLRTLESLFTLFVSFHARELVSYSQPIKYERPDSEHAQSDGKCKNRGHRCFTLPEVAILGTDQKEAQFLRTRISISVTRRISRVF